MAEKEIFCFGKLQSVFVAIFLLVIISVLSV